MVVSAEASVEVPEAEISITKIFTLTTTVPKVGLPAAWVVMLEVVLGLVEHSAVEVGVEDLKRSPVNKSWFAMYVFASTFFVVSHGVVLTLVNL